MLPDELEAGRTAARVLLDAGHTQSDLPDRRRAPGQPGAEGQPRGRPAAPGHHARRSATPESRSPARCLAPTGSPTSATTATQRLLERTKPSALICFNDRLALGAYQALADAGLDVPADVSVVSFDDDLIASWVKPQLTTVALPHYELGRAAIEVLLGEEPDGAGRRARGADLSDPDAAPRARFGVGGVPVQDTGASRSAHLSSSARVAYISRR